MTERRRFTKKQRAAMFLMSEGRCPNPYANPECDEILLPSWHGDHITAYTNGGPTHLSNGQALCPSCNLKKGAK